VFFKHHPSASEPLSPFLNPFPFEVAFFFSLEKAHEVNVFASSAYSVEVA
jgi:hypothetical protein